MRFEGTAHKYGRDVDTDVIIPARYLNTSDPDELAKHCLEDLDAEFVGKMSAGDILIAEENPPCSAHRSPVAPVPSRDCQPRWSTRSSTPVWTRQAR